MPNVILILADDLGWTDLGSYGSKIYETPNIDRLARDGMRFDSAYSACAVCSPTRASILTGKYPARLHLTDWIAGHERPHARLRVPEWTKFLPLEEVTIAERLARQGYATAHIGKWHLGGAKYYPQHQGFSINRGGFFRGAPPSYFSPYKNPELEDGPRGEYLTDRLADEAITFIKANRQRPFFIHLSHYAAHTPLKGKPEIIAKYRKKISPGSKHHSAVYASVIDSLDQSVGKIIAALDTLGLAENTVVIFTSDNGGRIKNTDNSPLRAGKGSAYEGGVRVPLIVKWPGTIKPGSRSDFPTISPDLFPTIADLTGEPVTNRLDGVSLLPLLRQEPMPDPKPIFWHYPHYHPGGATPYSAVRDGPWKLIHFYETNSNQLYHLERDLSELHDVSKKESAITSDLKTKLDGWLKSVDAQLPTPNSNFKGSRQ